MFHWLESFHLRVSRRLLNVSIGVRLFALMALAASVALVLAVAGVAGLGASKESLRSVYEDRMLPVQQLASIVNLMLANRMLLQGAISEVSLDVVPEQPAVLVMNPRVAAQAADAIEKNIARIGTLWQTYAGAARVPKNACWPTASPKAAVPLSTKPCCRRWPPCERVITPKPAGW